jgi:hypothetical protein
MSATLKFGTDGQWATKVGSALAYNDEGGNFKPLPFNFTRSTSGTRINKDGLIEVVTNNKPRIDFLNDSNGALLLEPSRSNLITYSEDFSQGYWSKSRATILSNQTISPDGTLTADLLTITDTPENYAQTNVSITVSGATQTVSCFVKKGTNDFAHILLWDTASNGSRQWFDVNNGTVGSSTIFGSGISVDSASIENYGNGWFRCIVVFNCSLASVRTRISASNGDGQTNGTIGKTIFIWGYQLESNSSYATSYIPTQGAISTRVAETCIQTPPSGIIGQTEGTIYFEYFKKNQNLSFISIDNDTSNNRIFIESILESNNIRTRIISGGVASVDNTSGGLVNGINKIALGYANNNVVLYHNGIQIFTDNTATIPSTSILRLGVNVSNSFQLSDGINEVKLYNTRLTNSELQALTSN